VVPKTVCWGAETGVDSPVDRKSPTPPLNEVLARIIIVGVEGLPMAPVLLRWPISNPPKQAESEQYSGVVAHWLYQSHPEPFCLMP